MEQKGADTHAKAHVETEKGTNHFASCYRIEGAYLDAKWATYAVKQSIRKNNRKDK
jgi:hypothetical protein